MDGTAVVTGGGSGTGAEVARSLAATGMAVVVAGRDADPIEAVVEEIHEEGGAATHQRADVRDEFDVEWLMETAARFEGQGIDLVVAAAEVRHGPPGETPLPAESYSAFDDHLRYNARGAFATVLESLPHLTDRGRVLVATHPSARDPGPGAGTYAVAKAATEAVVRGFGADLDRPIACVDPGADADSEEAADLFVRAAETDADRLDGSVIEPGDLD